VPSEARQDSGRVDTVLRVPVEVQLRFLDIAALVSVAASTPHEDAASTGLQVGTLGRPISR
jgi:hypothetical protein